MTDLGSGPGVAADGAVEDLQRSSLLRSVTHDLRTPLASIRAIVTDLRDGVAYDPETRVELLQTVCDEVDRLDRLVGNLLSMSRLEAGVLVPRHQAIHLDELVRHRLRALEPLLRDFEIAIDIPHDLPLADGDFGQLEEVLTNLLANAVRHAPAGSVIELQGRAEVDTQGASAEGAPFVELAVIDHGPGVPPEWQERVFAAFEHGPGSRSTGLGLAICGGIIQAHGGRLVLRDTPGGGATFAFTLPVRPEGEPQDDHERRSATGVGRSGGVDIVGHELGREGTT